jgi:hypothetical protein
MGDSRIKGGCVKQSESRMVHEIVERKSISDVHFDGWFELAVSRQGDGADLHHWFASPDHEHG